MTKRLLIVDDDLFLAKVYAAKLKKDDLEIITFKNGTEVYSSAKKNHPDLIILDLVMPEKDGFEVLSELQSDSSTKNIPVIVLSALAQKEDIVKTLRFGAKNHLVKNQLTFKEVMVILSEYL